MPFSEQSMNIMLNRQKEARFLSVPLFVSKRFCESGECPLMLWEYRCGNAQDRFRLHWFWNRYTKG